jgi:hypothetical protein
MLHNRVQKTPIGNWFYLENFPKLKVFFSRYSAVPDVDISGLGNLVDAEHWYKSYTE